MHSDAPDSQRPPPISKSPDPDLQISTPLTSQDTIVAVSSPPGRSPRGLIRLTGPDTRTILDQLLTPNEQHPQTLPPRQLQPTRLHLPLNPPSAGPPGPGTAATLPILAALFPAPHTYTAHDLAELQLPGHPALLDRLIHRCTELGARLAEPGEFTFRAYLAGRLDLTQAEGVAATIAAVSDSQLQAAALLRRGELGRFAHGLVDELATQLALVEAGIDFTDQEDVVPIAPAALIDNLAALAARIDDLTARSRSWGAVEALPRVVLVGPPSAGKSTLFNALLGRRRAVIAATPGTTRDVLEEPLTLTDARGRAVELMLVDLAGLDEPANALDRDVQAAARAALDRAELLLLIDDGRDDAQQFANTVAAESIPRLPSLRIRTKADHPPAPSPNPSPPGPGTAPPPTPKTSRPPPPDLHVSALTGQGLDTLREHLAARLAARAVSLAADMLALQPRHESALRAARNHLQEAIHQLAPQRDRHDIADVELIAAAMRAALDDLAALGGQMTPDDVIGRVFATFCVGK